LGITQVTETWERKFGKEMYEAFSSFVDINCTAFTNIMVSILPGLRDEFMVDYIPGTSGERSIRYYRLGRRSSGSDTGFIGNIGPAG
jgi:hypothetical protein